MKTFVIIICLLLSSMLTACGGKHVALNNGLDSVQVIESDNSTNFPEGKIVENQTLADNSMLCEQPVVAEEKADGGYDKYIAGKSFDFKLRDVPTSPIEPTWSANMIDWSREITGRGFARDEKSLLGYISILDNAARSRDNRVTWKHLFAISKKETRLGALTKPNKKNKSLCVGPMQINIKVHRISLKDALDPVKSAEWVVDHLLKLGFEKDPFRALRKYNGPSNKPATKRYALKVMKTVKELERELAALKNPKTTKELEHGLA